VAFKLPRRFLPGHPQPALLALRYHSPVALLAELGYPPGESARAGLQYRDS